MPRRSSPSNTRSTSARVAPPKQQQNQVAPRSGMGAGLMGSLMSGMAFGAGAELIRGLFRNSGGAGGMIMPLLLSGGAAFGAHKFLFRTSPYKMYITAAVFGGTFLATKSMFDRGEEQE